MDTLFAFLVAGCFIALPVQLVMIIVKKIQKKDTKKTKLAMLGCFIGMIISTVGFSKTSPQMNCDHEWEYATCLTPKTCIKCGKTEGKTSEHEWEGATCAVLSTCKVCGETHGELSEHTWTDATCKELSTCKVCGETRGELGEHTWTDATCKELSTCKVCGETRGELGEHEWEDATCTSPKTCKVCNSTDGLPLGKNGEHEWEEATCKISKSCKICGKEEGKVKEHTPGEWEITSEATLEKQGTRVKKCVVCNDIVSTEKFDSPYKVVADIIDSVAVKHGGKTVALSVNQDDNPGWILASGYIYSKNDEDEVYAILSDIKKEIDKSNTKVECVFTFRNKDDKDSSVLAVGAINKDGNCEITSSTSAFNSKRNNWINSQFSAWDGSHRAMKDLIIKNLNDEKSFKHIETTYKDISDEGARNEINKVLANAGYSARVEVGDLFIVTKFSAKNAFNATIKNTAYGIASYNNNTITLIAIE